MAVAPFGGEARHRGIGTGRLGDAVFRASVAAATGLSDQAHLTRAFRSRYGTTPAAYQRQVRGH